MAVSFSQIHLWEVATGKEIRTLSGKSDLGVLVAPDGTWLAAISGDFREDLFFWSKPLDPSSKGVPFWGDKARRDILYALARSPDGRTLAVGNDRGQICIWDVQTNEQLLPTEDQSQFQIMRIAPNSQLHVTGHADGIVRVWDSVTGRQICCRKGPNAGCWPAAFSPDGSFLVVNCGDDGVELWDVRTWKTIRRFGQETKNQTAIGFSPDGQYLLACVFRGQYRIGTLVWEVASGRLVQSREESVVKLLPNGRLMVQPDRNDQQLIELHDFETGKLLAGPFRVAVRDPVLSPDGQSVVGDYLSAGGLELLEVWRLSDGKRLRCFKPLDESGRVAFSPDGRYLASSIHDGTVQLWEIASGKECARFSGHIQSVHSFVFAPDGRTLTTMSFDGTALVWDLSHLADPPPLPPPADPLSRAWDDLASDHAPTARSAIFTLACHPDAVPFLAQRIHATPTPDATHLAELLRDLDASRFADRQRASAKLAVLDESARPTLERTLTTDLTPEARRRIRTVLDRIDDVVTDRELLRSLRAVHALEVAGSPAARRMLETLAAGDTNARLTKDAVATLARWRPHR